MKWMKILSQTQMDIEKSLKEIVGMAKEASYRAIGSARPAAVTFAGKPGHGVARHRRRWLVGATWTGNQKQRLLLHSDYLKLSNVL